MDVGFGLHSQKASRKPAFHGQRHGMIDKRPTAHFQWYEQSGHTSNRKPRHEMSRWLERMRIGNPAGLVLAGPVCCKHPHKPLFTEKEGKQSHRGLCDGVMPGTLQIIMEPGVPDPRGTHPSCLALFTTPNKSTKEPKRG
jgi:hypothetical protein